MKEVNEGLIKNIYHDVYTVLSDDEHRRGCNTFITGHVRLMDIVVYYTVYGGQTARPI